MSFGSHEQIYIKLSRLEQLESDSKDLKRAQALINRLRAEISVLKAERKVFVSTVRDCRHHIGVAGNPKARWAISLATTRLEKARLI